MYCDKIILSTKFLVLLIPTFPVYLYSIAIMAIVFYKSKSGEVLVVTIRVSRECHINRYFRVLVHIPLVFLHILNWSMTLSLFISSADTSLSN